MAQDRKAFAERIPMALVGLIVSDVGGAIPFGISDLEGNPNAAEWAVSVMFATAVLFAALSLGWHPGWLPWVAYASAVLWAVSALYMLANGDVETLARIAFALIFAGIAAGCVGIGGRLRASTPSH